MLRVLCLGLLVSPALLLETRRFWLGPLSAAVFLIVLLLASRWRQATLPDAAVPPPLRQGHRALHAAALVVFYGLTLFVFRKDFDIWEQFSWCAHTADPYGGFQNKELPTVARVMADVPGRWHGPHVTHGALHSRPVVLALRPFVGNAATRADVAAAMRVANTVACLLLVPLLFRGFVHLGLLADSSTATALALLSPGVLMVGSKGHWLGLSYGVASLALYALARVLTGGRGWRFLPLFLGAWGLLQALYSSAVLFAVVVAGALVGYAVASRRPRRLVLPRAAAALVPAAGLLAAIGGMHPEGLRGHLSGNGETLFEIARASNAIELQRFAGYWAAIAPRYHLAPTPSLTLVQRAGLGMAARNVETGSANLLGTGRFYSVWQSPNEGRIKSLGVVLPWLAVVGGLTLAVRQRGRMPSALWWLGGTVVVLVAPFLFTWDLSAHRLFGATLLLGATAARVHRALGDGRPIVGRLTPRHLLFAALYGQIVFFVILDRSGIFIGPPYR